MYVDLLACSRIGGDHDLLTRGSLVDISTPMLQPFVAASPEFAVYLDTSIPAGRLGRPGDVAGAAVWLACGAESAYVTGIALPVDGGFTAR